MKEFFKYSNGYININDENLFMTNSGNWSETIGLQEKSPKSIKKNSYKNIKFYIFFLIVCGIFLLSISFEDRTKEALPIALIVLMILAYKYFSKEMGSKYKIPLSKLKDIQIDGKEVKFTFLNFKGEEDFEIIHGVEEKGILVLSEFLQNH
ncbi:hypothetical protein NAT51_17370 [Flavobacterium amniphilum]|uniref:hypothetical protein n=1 Tax=Flavobacterium amniphilum TaxID=1834035 RepID=UPI002029E7CB|nr:hypothetical protein [Flavobacterium amniphilum]MCL9807305.1 hypothetical protein [Flavobacterium amniphilum]